MDADGEGGGSVCDGEGDVWGGGVAGGVDGDGVVSGHWGRNVRGGAGEGDVDEGCGRCRRRRWRCVRWCGGEGGVADGGMPRVVYWLMVVELFLVCG